MNAALLDDRFDPEFVDGLPPAARLAQLCALTEADSLAHQKRIAMHREFEFDQAIEDDLVPAHELRLRRPCGCCDE